VARLPPSSSCSAPASVQVCTAVMPPRLPEFVEHLASGLGRLDAREGIRGPRRRPSADRSLGSSRGATWDLNYKVVARIDQEKCIHCGLLLHHLRGRLAISSDPLGTGVPMADYLRLGREMRPGLVRFRGRRGPARGRGRRREPVHPSRKDVCVGCNMCRPLVCPVEGCITIAGSRPPGRPPDVLERVPGQALRGRGRGDPARRSTSDSDSSP